MKGSTYFMDYIAYDEVKEEGRPLTKTDVEALLHKAGSTDKLKLVGLNLKGIDLVGFNLTKADLRGADLSDADLRGAKLRGTKLRGAKLKRAKLSDADLSDADLSDADLSDAYIRGTRLNKANLSGVRVGSNLLIDANMYESQQREADLYARMLRAIGQHERQQREADLERGSTMDRMIMHTIAQLSGLTTTNKSQNVVGASTKAITIKDTSTFCVRIIEDPLTPQNLTSILSAITELVTKCWLIGNGRFADLIEYTQTHDVRFVQETQLTFTKITYNSPFEASFKFDLSASNIAEAIQTAIDGVVQVKQRIEKAELENKAIAQQIEQSRQKVDQENKAALLEQERLELANERKRLEVLEKRLEVQKKGFEYALEIATKTIAVLYPTTDEQTKAMLIQTLLPTILQLQNGKGLELVLPTPNDSEEKQ